MRFSRPELEAFRDAVVPDLLGPDTRLLFVGINPSLWTAAVGAHFARPGNRFYPMLHRAGLVDHTIDASGGCTAADHDLLCRRGIGITNLVSRATARADELSAAELVAGGARLGHLVEQVKPRVVAVLGISAYRLAFDHPKARTGRQGEDLAGAQLWVLPNPSGLNAHSSLADLADAVREVALAAGVLRTSPAPG